jgi:hypothetical protein
VSEFNPYVLEVLRQPLEPRIVTAPETEHIFLNIFSLLRHRRPEMLDRVFFTADAVIHIRPDRIRETICWDDLDEVRILTTDEGPWREDVLFLLIACNGERGCTVPQSCDGSKQLLERLQQLPDFDNDAVIKAMSSTSNVEFVCWKRPVA